MCGIAGYLGFPPLDEDYGIKLMHALHHRGPDGRGIKSWPEITLVHTRLSIIDLSSTGSQPMSNEDGTIWTVFNGEIYNHRELRHDLESRGHIFRGHSDTEILTHLYEEGGPEFITKLRGMFALAVYDQRNRTLVLARDPFGIKPLFYAPGKNWLAFASEIRALLVLPDIDTRPNKQAISDFTALFYIPAPETFYRGIRALQAGEILIAKLGSERRLSWRTKTYHRWSINPDFGLTLDRAADRADELVAAAVQRQLQTDVPLGSLLSGGIDSSLVSAAGQEALNGNLRTFNVRFPEKEYDETWAAVEVARYIGSHHETLDMSDVPGNWEYVTNLLKHAGQPFADTSVFAVASVCRLMRQHVTVAMSGDGGDEAFGGYDIYWRLARIARWQKLPRPLLSVLSLASLPLCGSGLLSARLSKRLQHLATADDTAIIQSLFSIVNDEEHENFLHRDRDVLPVRRLFERQWEHHLSPRTSRVERLSALATEVNTRLLLANDFLFKVDIASMKESLEVRVPMLDEELFAFGLSLPHGLKVKGQTCKRVLRAVAARRLPSAIACKPKWGFSIPLDVWAGADFNLRLKDTLLGPSQNLSEFFRPEFYRSILEKFCNTSGDPIMLRQQVYPRAMMLLAVQLALSSRN